MKVFFNLAALLILNFCFLANSWSLELEEARAKKLVIEQPNGYVKAVDASAKTLETQVNEKRRAAYESIVKENGGKLSLQQVEEQAAKKIQDKLSGK